MHGAQFKPPFIMKKQFHWCGLFWFFVFFILSLSQTVKFDQIVIISYFKIPMWQKSITSCSFVAPFLTDGCHNINMQIPFRMHSTILLFHSVHVAYRIMLCWPYTGFWRASASFSSSWLLLQCPQMPPIRDSSTTLWML